MVAARATWTRLAPLCVSSTSVFVPASTALTNPVPALTRADAPGSSAAAADRIDTPGSAGVIPAPSSSASAIMIGPFRFMIRLPCVGEILLTLCFDECSTRRLLYGCDLHRHVIV